MKLTLTPTDLKPQFQEVLNGNIYQNVTTAKVGFEHLSEEAQAVIRIVGRGTYLDKERNGTVVIEAPEQEEII